MDEKYGYGLFIGRFQPFHKGHLHALLYASRLCKVLVIGVGSSQEKGTAINPLSAKSRIGIIRAGLRGTGIDAGKIRFFLIPDFNDNDLWFSYIMERNPRIDVVFSRTRLVKRIFSERGIEVISPAWYERRRLTATRIRTLIKEGKEWKDRIPKGAVGKIAASASAIRSAKGRMIEKRV